MLDSNLLNRAGNAVKTFGSKKVKDAKNLGKKAFGSVKDNASKLGLRNLVTKAKALAMISAAPVLVNMPNLNAATLVPLNDNNNQEFVSLDSDTETTTNPLLENQNYSKETETKFFRTRQGALEAGENVKLADKGIEKAIDEYIESRDDENACDNHYFKVNIDPIRGQSLDEVKAKLIELGVQKALINKPIPGTSEGEGIENLTKLNAGIVRAEVFEGKDGQEQIKSVIISAPFLVYNAQNYLETENSDTIYNEYTRQPLTQKESVVIPNQYLDRGISGDTVRELLRMPCKTQISV